MPRFELHRLTTLQKQILRWIKQEGGGCLPVARLYTSLYHTQSKEADLSRLADRMAEAVEQLIRGGYVEVRDEEMKVKGQLSLYDYASFSSQLEEVEDGVWLWKKGKGPEVALSDFGTHYAAQHF